MRLLPLLVTAPLLLSAGCAADPKCGDGTHEEGGECVADEADADTDADTDTDTDTDTDPDLEGWSPWDGDASCVSGVTFTVDASCVDYISLSGILVDFQSGREVADATVSVWDDDDPSGSRSDDTVANADGEFTVDLPTCTPITTGSATPPEWEYTIDTYEQHRVYTPSDAGDEPEFDSFGYMTALLVPSLIGVEWDRSTAIIAGTALGCDQEPIQHVQIWIQDASGAVPDTGEVYYFSQAGDTSLPTDHDSQHDTNRNGLWVALNVPPGEWIMQMWGFDGAELVLLGESPITAIAGSVTLAEVHVGITDGVLYPAECLSSCR